MAKVSSVIYHKIKIQYRHTCTVFIFMVYVYISTTDLLRKNLGKREIVVVHLTDDNRIQGNFSRNIVKIRSK